MAFGIVQLESLVVKLLGDTVGLTKALSNGQAQVSAAAKKMEAVGDRLAGISTRLTLGVTAPLTALGVLLAKAASDAVEVTNKFDVSFQGITDRARDLATELDESYGLSRVSAEKLLGTTGDLLIGFGFTREAALDLSFDVQKLAVDLASYTNIEGGAVAASQKLTRGLLGEREALKSLDIAILESQVKQRVATNAANGLTFASDRQARVMATLQLSTEQSRNAIGDWERTSHTTANQARELGQDLEDLRVEFGRELLPIMAKVLKRGRELTASFRGLSTGAKQTIFAIGGVAASLGLIAAATTTVIRATQGVRAFALGIVFLVNKVLAADVALTTFNGLLTATGVTSKAALAGILAMRAGILGLVAALSAFIGNRLGTIFTEFFDPQIKRAREQTRKLLGEAAALQARVFQRDVSERGLPFAQARLAGQFRSTAEGLRMMKAGLIEGAGAAKEMSKELEAILKTTDKFIRDVVFFDLTPRQRQIAELEVAALSLQEAEQRRAFQEIRILKAMDAELTKLERNKKLREEILRAQKMATEEQERLREEMFEEGKALEESVFTPVQKFQAEVARFLELFKAGDLSKQAFDKLLVRSQRAAFSALQGNVVTTRAAAGRGTLEAQQRLEEFRARTSVDPARTKEGKDIEAISKETKLIRGLVERFRDRPGQPPVIDIPIDLELANFNG